MGTTKEDLQAIVSKLEADVDVQAKAIAEKDEADGGVVAALGVQATKTANQQAAAAAVDEDIKKLVEIAKAFSDQDPNT